MKNIILAALVAFGLILTMPSSASADIGPPGTVESTVHGVSVDMALACHATNLNSESKELYRTWADLNAKANAGTLTEDENILGSMIAQSGACFAIVGGLQGTVVLLDGHDYLVDYCGPEWGCIRVIQKSDGVDEN